MSVWPLSALACRVRSHTPRTHITVASKLAARLCLQVVSLDALIRRATAMRVAFHNVLPTQRVYERIERVAIQAAHYPCRVIKHTRILSWISPILGVNYD